MLLLPLLLATLLWPLAEIIRAVLPGWAGWVLVGAGVLASAETLISHRWYQTQHFSGPELWRARAVEFGLFFGLLRLAYGALRGWPAVPPTTDAIFTALFDIESLTAWAIAILCSLLTSETLDDLAALAVPQEMPNATDRGTYTSPYDALTGRFFAGGALVMVLAALAQLGVTGLADFARPPVLGLLGNVLLYFGLGFILLSQAQRTLLLNTWQFERVKVSPQLPMRWNRQAALFLGLAALIAFGLPTGYSSSVLDFVAMGLGWLLNVVWNLLLIVLSVLLWPLGWLLAQLPRAAPPALPPVSTPAPTPVLPATPPATGDLTHGYFAWVIIAGMVAYVLYFYVRDRAEWRALVKHLNLRRWWATWKQRWSALINRAQNAAPLQWLRERFRRATPMVPFNFFRLGAASPREQVLFYYRRLLRRAAAHGYARRPPETPHDYQPTLHTHLPAAHEEVDALTTAFLEARYSPHPVPPTAAQRARALWAKLRQALRQQ